MSKRAVLMMTFGSPEEITYEGVAEFFTNIRRGVRPEPHEIQTLYESSFISACCSYFLFASAKLACFVITAK